MTAFTKHLSTHVYFHMDRNQGNRKSSGPGTSGFGPLVPDSSPPSLRSRTSGGSKDSGGSSAALVVTGFERLSRTLRAGLDPFQDPDQIDPTEDTAFLCENPYVMSPDFASARDHHRSGGTSRKRLWRRSRPSPEAKYETKELQNYGVYGHRFEPSTRSGLPSTARTGDYRTGVVINNGGGGGGRYASVQGPVHSRTTGYDYDSEDTDRYSQFPSHSRSQDSCSGIQSSSSGRLDSLDHDCFVIPSHKIERFLPVQTIPESNPQALGMMEIRNPQLCLVIDFGENATFASQDLPSPTGGPLALAPKEWTASQLGRQKKLFSWVRESKASSEGMLLMNVERHCQFPFVTYLVLNSPGTCPGDPRRLIAQLQNQVNSAQTHEEHHIAGYEEVASIIRPPVEMMHAKIASSFKTGYIISAFRVFPGEDREKLERSWLTWTGARQIYKRLPKQLGLRRIAFHKKIYPERGITYVLVCECTALMDFVTEACCFVDQLRARCCGYTALYRVVDMF